MAKGIDRITGDYNNFWKERDFLAHLKKFKAALLMSHGFNDWNVMPEHSYRIYKAIKEKGDIPCQVYYHQNGHGGEPPIKIMNRWFTRYLHGVENGVENDPKAWIVREYDDPQNPTPYKDYPHPDAKAVELYLSAGAPGYGKLNTEAPTKQGIEVLIDNFSFSGEALARAEYTNHRLMFVSSVLTDSVHISGLSKIKIKLASSKPAANLSVWLVSLPWTENRRGKITDNIITRGWADPQNYKSLSRSKPLKPGKFYEFTFDLQPDDQIIPKGQQIGLMIFSSDKDYTLHPDPGTELTIDLDNTVLTLPIVGGKKAFK
jgi:X-Pro dipeptidyl-peptidase